MDNETMISASEQELNLLFKELLDGCRDDLKEAKLNVEMFLDEVLQGSSGKERFGNFYNDALRIKGDARDRQLKLLNMFKDRVTTKEKNEMIKTEMTDNVGALPSIHEMNQYIEEVEKNNLKPIPIVLNESLDHEFENEQLIKDSYKTIYESEDDEDLEDYEIDHEDEEIDE